MLVKLPNGNLAVARMSRGKNGPVITFHQAEVRPNVCDHWCPNERLVQQFYPLLLAAACCDTCAKGRNSKDCEWCKRK